jgi:hypothetical protein
MLECGDCKLSTSFITCRTAAVYRRNLKPFCPEEVTFLVAALGGLASNPSAIPDFPFAGLKPPIVKVLAGCLPESVLQSPVVQTYWVLRTCHPSKNIHRCTTLHHFPGDTRRKKVQSDLHN